MIVFPRVRVLDVKVVAALLDLVRRHLPGPFGLLRGPCVPHPAPPVDTGLQMFQTDRPGLGIGLLARGNEMLIEPDVPGCLTLLEEQQVGADGSVGLEYRIGQANNGMQIAFLHQMLLEPRLDSFAEQRTVGQHHGGPPTRLQQADDQSQKQVRRLSGPKVLREVALDTVFFLAAKGRIGEHNVHPLLAFPAGIGPRQSVVMTHETRILNAVQQHVCDTEHVGKVLLLYGAQRHLHGLFILGPLDIALAHVPQGTGQEAARATGRIKQRLTRLRVDPVHHEGGHRAGRVVLARITRRLQVIEDLFVDVTEMLTFAQVVEVDLVDLVDHLTHQLAGFHVIVGILEHDCARRGGDRRRVLSRKELLEPGTGCC